MIPQRTVTRLVATITGNVADQPMLQQKNGRAFGSEGIEAGGRIDLLTATTCNVLVKDANGKVLHSASGTITADEDTAATAAGIKGPLTVTVTNISNSAHTLNVYWDVKK